MKTPKLSCENEDVSNFTVMKKGQRVEPTKEGHIYYIITRYEANADKIKVNEAIRKAFDIWQEALQPIKFIKVQNYERAHIKIAFTPQAHIDTMLPIKEGEVKCGCPYEFDGAEGVLAHAFPAVGRNKLRGHLHLDEDENWAAMHSENKKDLLSVLVHELGHCLNIGHSQVKKAIMYPAYTGVKTKLHSDDLEAINYIYGDLIRQLVLAQTESANTDRPVVDIIDEDNAGGCSSKVAIFIFIIMSITALLW